MKALYLGVEGKNETVIPTTVSQPISTLPSSRWCLGCPCPHGHTFRERVARKFQIRYTYASVRLKTRPVCRVPTDHIATYAQIQPASHLRPS